MAEPVDVIAAQEAAEEAALTAHSAELGAEVAIPEQTVKVTGAMEETPPPTPSSPEPPPSTEPPPAPPDVPPAAPTPAEVPPAAPPASPPAPEEQAGPKGEPSAAWKRAREAERTAREAREELQRERERLAEMERRQAELRLELERQQQPPEVVPEDETAQLRRELEAVRERQQHLEIENNLNQQAADFRREHTDYDQAVNFLFENERKAAELSGELDANANRLRQIPQAADEIRRTAIAQGKTEAEVARELATAVMYRARRDQMIAGAQAQGKRTPEIVYELAQLRGYKPGNGNGATAPSTQPAVEVPAVASAAEEARAAQAQAAATTLSTLATSSAAPPKPIRSRSDLLALPASEQERYIMEMDAKAQLRGTDPQAWATNGSVPVNWHELLTP